MSTGMDAAMHRGYASHNVNPAAALIADRWWTLLIRGLAAIGFGIFALVAPRTSVLVIVWVFGAYALVDGFAHLLSAWRDRPTGRGWAVFEGLTSVAVGIVALAWTGVTTVFLLMLIAAWAVITGIAEIAAAIRLRREIRGEWLLATSGVLSIVLGVVLFMAPGVAIVTLMWIIGAYAIVFGLLLIALAVRLRSWRGTAGPLEPVVASPA